MKVEPPAGVAMNVMVAWALCLPGPHVPAAQVNDPSAVVIVPVCPETLATVPVISTVLTTKLAVTFWAMLIVTWQAPAPVQAPPQPANVDSASGVAVMFTVWNAPASVRG